jgi:hypothetical protein
MASSSMHVDVYIRTLVDNRDPRKARAAALQARAFFGEITEA